MKNINDYKGTKTAIHCKTKEEWDKINKLIGKYLNTSSDFKVYNDQSCLYMNGSRSDYSYAVRDGRTIIPASDFITPRTIEQIETELEVLRNELAMLKAETQPKKKIEFVKVIHPNMNIADAFTNPSFYASIKVISSFAGYDIMEAFDSDGTLVFIYLGHFNDGIK